MEQIRIKSVRQVPYYAHHVPPRINILSVHIAAPISSPCYADIRKGEDGL